MDTKLFVNRKIEGLEGWYAASHYIRDNASHLSPVVFCDYLITSSSAGDWMGCFVQRIGRMNYLIPFSQENNYPHAGYTAYIDGLRASWESDSVPTEDEVISIAGDVFGWNDDSELELADQMVAEAEAATTDDDAGLTIQDILEALDGAGLIVTSWDDVGENLNEKFGLALFDTKINRH